MSADRRPAPDFLSNDAHEVRLTLELLNPVISNEEQQLMKLLCMLFSLSFHEVINLVAVCHCNKNE
jgi:hypothetical protein